MQVEEKVASQVQQIVGKRLADNNLSLPPPPTAVMRCMELLRDPELSLKNVAPVVESDPVLAARILRAANSAVHGGMDRATSIAQCLTRLGVERLKAVLVESAASRLFESRDPRIAEATHGLWEHSLAVAMLARDVAALIGMEDTETAYLAGLLHDVGKPVVAWVLLETEKSVVGARTNMWLPASTWVEVIQRSHRELGVQLAQRWNLPEPTVKAIADCAEFDSGERASAANCVRFANALAKREGVYVGKVDLDDINALLMIGRSLLGIEQAVLDRLCTGLVERVKHRMG